MGDRSPPSEGATSRLVLVPEDLERISAAIRTGLAKEPPDPEQLRRAAMRSWFAPAVGLGMLLLLYVGLTHWRPAVDPFVQANALPATEVLTHQPADGNVHWAVRDGQVQALTVEGTQSVEVMIGLPIPSGECAEVAAALGATCSGRTIQVQAPVTVAWSAPQVLKFESRGRPESVTSQVRLTLQRPSGEQMGATGTDGVNGAAAPAAPPLPQLTIADDPSDLRQWCFVYQPTAAATLSVSGGSGGYQRPFDPTVDTAIDCTGLRLRVNPSSAAEQPPPGSARATSIVTLAGISALDVTATSRHLHVSALTGNLRLEEGVNRVIDTETVLRGRDRIQSALEIQAGAASLTVTGRRVTSIETDAGNLVATVWQRNHELALPIFLGLVGLMTPLLGAAYRNTFDYLLTRQSLLRRVWRRVRIVTRWIIGRPQWLLGRLRARSARQPG